MPVIFTQPCAAAVGTQYDGNLSSLKLVLNRGPKFKQFLKKIKKE
jgi:hypothetical protein